MTTQINGWVIININHPSSGREMIIGETFSYTRKEAIRKFITGSGSSWLYWKKKYNFSAAKAVQTIIVTPH